MPVVVTFRVREGKDNDLELAFSNLPSYIEKSDIIREALRNYFFNAPTPLRDSLDTQPRIQIPEKPRAPTPSQPVPETVKEPKKPVATNNNLESKLNKTLGF